MPESAVVKEKKTFGVGQPSTGRSRRDRGRCVD
jgi:hypothetical protein